MQEYLSEYSCMVKNANISIYQKAQMDAVEARSRLQEKAESAQIDVVKRAQIEAIVTFEKERRDKNTANIASLRQLQKTKISLTENGEVEVHKELFGETKSDRTNFRIINYIIFQSLQDAETEVLAIEFVCEGKKKKIFFNTADLTSKVIKQKLNQRGIRFGFSQKKEEEIRELLVVYLLRTAPIREIPESHGWFRDRERKLSFAFPMDQTWKEIRRLI